MRVKVDYISTSKDVYLRFRKEHPDTDISFKKWKEVVYTYNYAFRDYILETGNKAKLSWGFGEFAISKKKIKKFKEHNGVTYVNLPIDWKKTKEAGKKIYMFNAHTDGYRCKWYWFIKEARFYQHEVWVFKPSRVSSRKITEYLNKTNKKYIDLYKCWHN